MTLLQQLRHDLLCKARLSLPEVDALLGLPELAVEDAAPTAAQVNLQALLGTPVSASNLRMALGTFHRTLVGQPAVAEAATDETAPTLVSDIDTPVLVTDKVLTADDLTASLVDLPSGSGD